MWRRLLVFLALLVGVLALAPEARAGEHDTIPKEPLRIVVGAYVDRVTALSLHDNRYHADFYVWFRWTGGDGTFEPLKTFEVANGTITERSGEVREEHRDYHYACVRCEADFTEYFDVSRFPFDDHVLRIEIEDSQWEAQFVEYVADTANCGGAASVQVPGWEVGKVSGVVTPYRYDTNYGNVDLPPGEQGSVYSRFVLSVPLHRSGAGYFLKLFFGLFIAVGIALLALHIKPTDLDPRFGLPVGSIFAAVGSLYVVTSQLPDTNVITLSDRLHILAFGVIFVTLVESTMSLHRWSAGDEAGSRRMDRITFRTMAVFYVASAALAVAIS